MKRGSESRIAVALLSMATLILAFTFTYSIGMVDAEELPKLYVNPSAYTPYKSSEVFQIQVKIYHVWGLAKYEFKLAFNSTQLQCLNASQGDFFPQPPRSASTIQVNNVEGYVSVQTALADGENPLNGDGFLAFIVFNASYGVPYPTPRETSQLHLYDSHLYGAGSPPPAIEHYTQDATYYTPWQPPTLTLTMATSQNHYDFNQDISVSGGLSGNGYPVADAYVAVEVDTPTGRPIVARTIPTGTDPPTGPLEILEAYPCDYQTGQPKIVFGLNQWAGFKVAVKNNSQKPQTILVTINIYDANNAAQALMATAKTVDAGQTSVSILCYCIESPFASGTATMYANVFTNWIKNGGTALCNEKTAAFTVTDMMLACGSGETAPLSLAVLSAGNYALSFRVPTGVALSGVYKSYAKSTFMDETAFASIGIHVGLLCDLNDDGKVSLQDLILLAQAYGSTPDAPNWNPRADFNGDQKISLPDLVTLAQNFGKTI